MIATGTTWGLSGPTFLWLYGGLCGAIAATIYWQWQRALGPKPTSETADLDAYRLAMLNGGPQLAITAAAMRLHKDGVLGDGDDSRTLVVSGRLDADADELERAVFDAVEDEPQIETATLRRELSDCEPVKRLQSRLTNVGLLIKPEVVSRLRRLTLLAAALVALGGARLWVGIDKQAPVGYLAIMVCAVAFATVWLRRKHPWATARGRALVSDKRRSRTDLSSGTTGPELPLAIALFGGAALWAAEPALAYAWNVPRENASSWAGSGGGAGGTCGGGWSSGCGSSGGGDGGGGGGGGCGGGCGGGS